MVLKYVEIALGIVNLICQGVIFINLGETLKMLKEVKAENLYSSFKTTIEVEEPKACSQTPRYGGGAPDPNFSIPCPPNPNNADEIEPMKLRMKSADGYEIWLDDKRLHHIESYKIESSPYKNKAELSIKMLVEYPATQESKESPPKPKK